MPTLAFRNPVQLAVWKHELTGQLSDGRWENTRPANHWHPWCFATAVVDPENLGRDFWAPRESYGFTSTDLLEIIGERMIMYAKLARCFPDHVEVLQKCIDINGALHIPLYEDHGKSTYWTDIRKSLEAFDMVQVQAKVEADPFSLKDLKQELRDMQRIIKMRRK